MLVLFSVAQEAAAQHRRQGERDKAGNQNCGADGDGKFMKQSPDDPTHEEYRDEYRGERHRHRQNREANLASAIECRLHRLLAHFHVAHDVLEHHDRVIDHKADRERKRH